MRKTTVYLSEEQKAALSRLSAQTGRSEAELIREAVSALAAHAEKPRPRGSVFDGGVGGLAERVDEALVGFGER